MKKCYIFMFHFVSFLQECKTVHGTLQNDLYIFLDLTIFKSKYRKLHTNVYRKTTDINTMLKADSFHPNWLKNIYTFWPVPMS